MNVNNHNAAPVVGVFESWNNGGTQLGGLYLTSEDGQDRVNEVVERNKGSFAHLHWFTSEEEAIKQYSLVQEDIERAMEEEY